MSIIRAETTSFMIAYFRSLHDSLCKEAEPNRDYVNTKPECPEDDSVEDKSGSDSVEDGEEGYDDEEDVISDDNANGPWYSDRGDVKMIGDILVDFFKEKIKLSLVKQGADSYAQAQAHRAAKRDQSAGILTRCKLFIFGEPNSKAEAADKALLKALVEDTVEKISEKMRLSIVQEYIEAKKKRWIELCGTHNVDNLISYSVSKNIPFYIHVGGFYEKEGGEAGFGAIIRDFRGNPLACYSEYIFDKEDQVSSFYHELQGVNAALDLASKLKLEYFTMFSTRSDVGFLVMDCQAYENKCRCDYKCLKPVEKRCLECVRRCVLFCQEAEMDDIELEKIYLLLLEVMDKLLNLDRMGVTIMGTRSFNTGSVYYLAKLKGHKGEIELGDLECHPELQELLFREASGELGSVVFCISLSH